MFVGLAGAHRTGKTTLMREYASRYDYPFVETQTADVWKELGVDPRANLAFSARLEVQNHILDRLIASYDAALGEHYDGELILVDRTPLDALAYLMADVGNQPIDERAFAAYHARCTLAMNKYFDAVVLVQPGIKLVDAENKGALSQAYINHLNYLLIGLITNASSPAYRMLIRPDVTSLESRIGVLKSLVDVVEAGATQLPTTTHH